MDATSILSAMEEGDPHAAEKLLPLVYDELRKLAARKLWQAKPGQTLQPTALVHEAYIRLVDVEKAQHWNSRGHFFAAAAEAMRRILVEGARRKKQLRRGGNRRRIPLEDGHAVSRERFDEVLAVDGALHRLEESDPLAAKLVKLRFFGGLTMPEAAEAAGIPLRTAERNWTYARTWLYQELSTSDTEGSG